MYQTEYEIYLDYQRSITCAEELLTIAGNMVTQIQSETASLREELMGGWKGEAAGEFQRKLLVLSEKGGELSRTLSQIGEMQKTVAWNIYEAEVQALRIAQQRNT